MKGLIAWMAATLVYGWLCGVLGPHPDPVRCGIALAAWLVAWGVFYLLRDLKGVRR